MSTSVYCLFGAASVSVTTDWLLKFSWSDCAWTHLCVMNCCRSDLMLLFTSCCFICVQCVTAPSVLSLSLSLLSSLSLYIYISLSLSLSLSLSQFQSNSIQFNSIQNCFIGMTVNDTILPKLSIHVQKDENK